MSVDLLAGFFNPPDILIISLSLSVCLFVCLSLSLQRTFLLSFVLSALDIFNIK